MTIPHHRHAPVTGLKSYIRYNTCALQQAGDPGASSAFTPLYPMVSPATQEVVIVGRTADGHAFRPSDWAERLAGVMSSFRPGGAQPGSHLSYSPWCVPNAFEGFKCVVVQRDLRELEPMAWDFVLNFARDNGLQLVERAQRTVNVPGA